MKTGEKEAVGDDVVVETKLEDDVGTGQGAT